MHTDKAGIYVDAHKLRRVLYQALFDMDKRDRVVFGERAMTELGEFIAAFAMAYDFPEERNYYIRKMCAVFSVLLIDLRIMAELNVYRGAKNSSGDVIVKGEIFELVGRIDLGISKWRSSIKGKSAGEPVCANTDKIKGDSTLI